MSQQAETLIQPQKRMIHKTPEVFMMLGLTTTVLFVIMILILIRKG